MSTALILGVYIKKLADICNKQATLIWEVEDDIKWLLDTQEWLSPLLRDADRRRREMRSGPPGAWLCQIRQLAHEIKRVVAQLQCKSEIEHARNTWPQRLVTLPSKVPSRRTLAKQIRKIKEKLDNILADKDKYNYYNKKYCGVGLDEDMETIATWLIEDSANNVISIVGMAGSGKSVLANILFQSELVRSHFQCYGRIFVSQEYEMKELLEGFMTDAKLLSYEEMKEMTEQGLANTLQEHLKDKRYLVVIDDLWDKDAWDFLRSVLPEGLHGSKIILTTRDRDIARHADPSSLIHEMRLLNSEESWKLFCNKAFPSSSCPANLEELGKKIVARCDGLPLPIATLAKLLHGTETKYKEWSKVLDNFRIGFQNSHAGFQYEEYQHIRRSLALSYDDLPYQLQLCFLYFAVFTEGYIVEAARIKCLWISEELIAEKWGLTLEAVAEQYLHDLIQKSMILVEEKTDYGNVKSVRLHNLFWDLARAEADDIRFVNTQRATDIINTHHDRLALHDGFDDFDYNSLNSTCPKLCSFICICPQECDIKKSVAFPKLEYLKVLEINGIPVERLPDDIGNMIYLAHLNLRNTGLKQIPNSIGNLGRLKTIDLRETRVRTIADTFWTIPTLRDVQFEKSQFVGTPKLVSPLEDLEVLVGVRSGRWMSNLGNSRNMLQLELNGVTEEHEKDLVDALGKLKKLEALELEGEAIPAGIFEIVNHPTLESLKLFGKVKQLQLQLNVNLDLLLNLGELSLFNTKLGPEDIKIIAALPNLQSLRFLHNSYTGKQLLCPTGSFPSLKTLVIDDLQELEIWEVEGAMRNLRKLKICNCFALVMLPEGLRSMTKLEELKLVHMLDMIRSRAENEDGEDYQKIKHIKRREFV